MMIWSAHLSMLFRESPFLERPAAARAAGFGTVETWWPGDEPGRSWASATAAAGLSVAAISCYAGDVEAGDRGFLNRPERRDECLDDLRRALELARLAGAPRVTVLVGRALPGVPQARQLAEVAAALRECVALAADFDVTLMIEAINERDVPGYLLPTTRDAVALVEAVGTPRLRLLYDAYHAAMAGADPAREAAEFADFVVHVHYADCPGRGAPGTGRSDVRRLVESLDAAGYQGAVGLEYDPRGPTLPSLAFLPDCPPSIVVKETP